MTTTHILKLCLLLSIFLIGSNRNFACGGLFCQNNAVLQSEERIIFTINGNDTVTAYVQITYAGTSPQFSWVVPVPTIPEIDVAEIETFDELEMLTDPVIIAPPVEFCNTTALLATATSPPTPLATQPAFTDDVDVLSSGTAGPYAFDVVDSDDPNALIFWLRNNGYRVDLPMEPLIRSYNGEGMIFLAMKLQPDASATDIQPVVMTYESEFPMIPIRLTAVAAVENMNILTWVLGESIVVPDNYANPEIHNDNIRGNLSNQFGTNYMQLLDDTIDIYDGQAMLTEYAQPTIELQNRQVRDPLLQQLLQENEYVTRFIGRMSPDEMTVDPSFVLDEQAQPVSNIRDLSQMDSSVFWGCTNQAIELDKDTLPPSSDDSGSLPIGFTFALILVGTAGFYQVTISKK